MPTDSQNALPKRNYADQGLSDGQLARDSAFSEYWKVGMSQDDTKELKVSENSPTDPLGPDSIPAVLNSVFVRVLLL